MVLNTGKTPAIDAEVAKITMAVNDKNPKAVTTSGNGRSVIAPSGDETFYVTANAPDDVMTALQGKKARAHLRCVIAYRDIFKRRRETDFCVYYPTSEDTPNWFNCPDGNSMK
jgi:hypothetical protein